MASFSGVEGLTVQLSDKGLPSSGSSVWDGVFVFMSVAMLTRLYKSCLKVELVGGAMVVVDVVDGDCTLERIRGGL